ncbi:glycosyltransferase family 2 protein [Labedella populi]|uniref:Glycosyltransferase family 2 protein n=2 Tax=Labedella populi TaxID=2498850 RepID=A0A444QGS2_9MICO|nr:glycosyltransferase family 2 protein [Labedella populi]
MTLMVRDEADIIAPMLEHHLAQGIDLILVTDNGSVDGTREIIENYVGTGRVLLSEDPRHEKQQSTVVTAMAREAYEKHGADWVINADADEFWLAVDRRQTLKQAFEGIPQSVVTFHAPVTDMTGIPARQGAGIRRLRWRDHRSPRNLWKRTGLHAHATPDAVHIGSSTVEVIQGNHNVNLKPGGEVPVGSLVEVLHFPWRSWAQYGGKVERSGAAYAANPLLRPSPKHHGMRDYRRHLADMLEHFYVFRHSVVDGEVVEGAPEELGIDDAVIESLESILASGTAVRPDLVEKALDDSEDEPYRRNDWEAAAEVARLVIPLETAYTETLQSFRSALQKANRDLRAAQAVAGRPASRTLYQRGRSFAGRMLRTLGLRK